MDKEVSEYYEGELARVDAEAERNEARFWQEAREEVCAKRCNQYGHVPGCNKGTTREIRDKAPDKRLVIDDFLTEHEKVANLAELIEQARKDGARLEVDIKGAPWGDTLILPCGREDPKEKAGAHGVKHALEERHHVTAKEVADTLLHGRMEKSDSSKSRLYMFKDDNKVVLEREIHMGTWRVITQGWMKITHMTRYA